MKKQILLLCFVILGITAYSQDTTKTVKPNEKEIEFFGVSFFNRQNLDNKKDLQGINLMYEDYFDSINESGIISINATDVNIRNIYIGYRWYWGKRYIKFFHEGGMNFINYYNKFNIGLCGKVGINLGRLRSFNTDLYFDYNLVTNAYNFYEIGISFKIKNFFKK